MSQNIKILVAEDDLFLMQVYELKFAKENFEMISATDGEEASMKIKMEKPDIVLLDLIMPGKNGFEVLSEMKTNEETCNIPVLILSNLGQDSDISKGLSMGADEFLIKASISIEELVEKIKKYANKIK